MSLDPVASYLRVYRIRRFEERVSELRHGGEITCSVHLCIGHEQVAVGARAALNDDDYVVATYRGHHWALEWGVPVEALYAEFLGRAGGINGGRTGAGLFLSPRHGFLGETGIIGGGAPIAVGAALASRYDESGRISVVSLGDGAMNQGAVHEAMNLAAVLRLGVIFVCENNGYAEYTPTGTMFGITDLAERAQGYGFPGVTIDGTDVDEVQRCVTNAAERARGGEGPTFVNALVRRLEGHHTHDPEHYRPTGEKEAWRASDPLARMRTALLRNGQSEDEIRKLEHAVDHANEAALDQARMSPLPDGRSVTEHVHG